MTKLDYLKYAIAKECHVKKAWIVSAFATIIEDSAELTNNLYPGKIIKTSFGYSYLDDSLKPQAIENSSNMDTLYTFKDTIEVDKSLCLNATTSISTNLGNLLFNLIAMVPAFKDKVPFITGKVSVSMIEDMIADRLKDNPKPGVDRSATDIYVDEYIQFSNALQYIASLSQVATYAATPKGITAPPGIREFKATLIKKYGDSLTDPVELAKFEKELADYDDAYLKDDPAYGKFIKGKIKDVARKKMFLSIGADKNFKSGLRVTPILNSLEEGWPTDRESITNLMNATRAGSYSRGSETVKGGVSAKIMLRAANNFIIEDTDCGSTLGIHRVFSNDKISMLVGRSVIDKQSIYIENKDIAANYLNRPIVVRSPMYCKLQGDTLCKVCAGDKLAQYPTGLTIPVTEISSIILAASMAAMHAQVLSTAKLDVQQYLT